MTNKELKKNARLILNKKWLKASATAAIFTLIQLSLAMLIKYLFTSQFLLALCLIIVSILIQVPFIYGLITSFLNLKENKKFTITDFITIAVDNFGTSWSLALKIFEKIYIPLIIECIITLSIYTLLVSTLKINIGIIFIFLILITILILSLLWILIETISYTLSYLIAYKHPRYTIKKVFEENEKIIIGNKKQLGELIISFIGWIILSILTFGVSNLWTIPYMIITLMLFYDNISQTKDTKKNTKKITNKTTKLTKKTTKDTTKSTTKISKTNTTKKD